VGNAIKFTEKGSVEIRIVEAEKKISVYVKDTGPGISKTDQAVIFERFRQADGSATREHEGTGLGLSIAREIIRLHGGEIGVESQPGKGSEFFFSLPIAAEAIQAAEPQKKDAGVEPIAQTQTASKPTAVLETKRAEVTGRDRHYELEKDKEYEEAVKGSGELILIIDDNAVNREVVKTRLEMHQYRTCEAADGMEGLKKIKEEKPDLIILDLMMPRMSGYEFCKKVRKNQSADELPVIMLTAKTEMGDKVYGLQVGANDYISKPFHKEELVARVGVLLKLRAMTQELKRWNLELETRVDERTKELAKAQEQLIQAEKMATVGTLAGGVAHEINNPLTAVLTNAQLLKLMGRPEDKESIELIEEGAKRCQTIIRKLMKYARKSSAETPAAPVNLAEVIRSVKGMLGYQLEQENVVIELDLEEQLQTEGWANELEQVFTNLFLNARDAILSKKTEGKISVIANSTEADLKVTVKDNGVGIKKDHLKKIFDPFFTTKDVGRGTGLGLAVTYGILEKHGARVEVLSEPNVGTEFHIKLPKISSEKNLAAKG